MTRQITSLFAFGLMFAAATTDLCAQDLPPAGSSTVISLQPASTAEAQLRHAQVLRQRIYACTTAQQRFAAIAETLANIAVVSKSWPNDRSAIVQAALLEGEIGMEWGIVQKTIDALAPIISTMSESDALHGERLLGQAYEQSGRSSDAEQHLLAAERHARSKQVSRLESEAAFQALAQFYVRQNRPKDAMQRFHAIIELPGEDGLNQAVFALASLKEAVKLADDPDHVVASSEYATLSDKIFFARHENLTTSEAATLDTIATDAQAVKDRNHF